MKNAFVFFFLLTCSNAFSQNRVPFRNGDKWGFSDTLGNIVIDTIYDGVSFFYDASANVRIADRYFLINPKGERISDMSFDEMGEYSEGLYSVKKDEVYGFINSKGKLVVPPKYAAVSPYNSGLAAFQVSGNDKIGFLDAKGKIKIKPQFDQVDNFVKSGFAIVKKDSVLFIINKKGKKVSLPSGYAPINVSANGYITVTRLDAFNRMPQNLGAHVMIYNTKGKLVYDLTADTLTLADYPSGDHIVVRRADGNYRFVNLATGRKSPFYNSVRAFNDGFAIAGAGKDITVINEMYETVCTMDPQAMITDIGIPSEGYIPVQSDDEYFGAYYGYMTTNCTVGVAFVFDEVGPFKNGYAIIKFDGKLGVINKFGKKYWND